MLQREKTLHLFWRECCVWLRRCQVAVVDFPGGAWYDGTSERDWRRKTHDLWREADRAAETGGAEPGGPGGAAGRLPSGGEPLGTGAALPDAAKLLPCARLFSVDVEWLLDEEQDGEDRLSAAEFLQGTERPSVHRDWPWYIAGGIVTGAGSLGMVTMGILSAVFPVVVSEAPAGVEWVRIYTGLAGFLKAHGVEWLFALWAAVALAGLWLLAQPPIRRREQTASQFSPWYAAGVAVGLYGVGQTAWYVQLGKLRDLPLLALFLAAAVWCTVRQFWRLGGEPDETRRRQERIIALLYTVAQGVLLLLTAEAGFGLVALVLHIGVYFICAAAITWRRSGRGKH